MVSIAKEKSAVAEAARQLAVDVMYSEKGQFADARMWRMWHRWLGLPSAALAALAGAAFLADWWGDVAPAIAAFASAAVTAVVTFLKPEEVATRHHNAGVTYGGLRRRLRHFVQIECGLTDRLASDLAATLDTITQEVNALQSEALPISKGAYRAAKKEIESGAASYTDDELTTAAGNLTAGAT